MTTTVDSDDDSTGLLECWCCGSRHDPAGMVHLGNHAEVALCLSCARWVGKRAGMIEDQSKSGPLVHARDGLRRARRGVVERGWHHNRLVGPPLRWIGRRLP